MIKQILGIKAGNNGEVMEGASAGCSGQREGVTQEGGEKLGKRKQKGERIV